MTAPRIDLEQLIGDRLAARDDDGPYDREAVEEQMATEIGDAVRALRQHVGLNQGQVAALMSASQPTINRIETGQVIATLSSLVRILRALDVPHLYVDLTPDGISIDVKKSLRGIPARQRTG
jgi:ribosome-binding protein aMBF1 (putative translation factor)